VRIEVVATSITIEVTDDGVGFPEHVRSGGMGLVNLESRADGLGGRVEFGSVDGGGARVLWSIPV
jgi:signal transduction histidine kinase